ncbi:MAG: metallophosphoesterase [Bacteroidia bacterium]
MSHRFITLLAFICSVLFAVHADGQSLISRGKWRMYTGLNEPVESWKKIRFNESSWRKGSVPFSAGGIDGTLIMPGKKTNYFRNEFMVGQVNLLDSLRFKVYAEDGFVIYLNGKEVSRCRMPDGTPGYSTPAIVAAPQGGKIPVVVSVPSFLLNRGKNVVALEVHQAVSDQGGAYLNFEDEPVFNAVLPQLIRGPYLQSVNHHSCIVVWRTDFPTDSRVLITEKNGKQREFYHPLVGTEHAVMVDGLAANDSVGYQIGTSVHWLTQGPEYKIHTAPLPGVIQPVRIWALGDFGNGSADQQTVLQSYVNYLGDKRNDMWIWLGDNAYGFGLDSEYSIKVFNVYKEQFKSWNFYPAPGNHDYGFAGYQSANALTTNFPYFDIFRLPVNGQSGGKPSGTEKYYSYDWSNIHFIALDSYGAYNDPDSPMYKWLEEDLKHNGQRWTIAYWHHPPYSLGSHNSNTEIEMVNIRNNIVPLLEKYGVDMVLTGHSHTYERSYFIRGHYGTDDTFDSTMLVQPGDGSLVPYNKDSLHKGAVYVVCGVGGQRSGNSFSGFPHNAMAVSYTSVNGSSVLEIDHDTLAYKFLRSDGVVADSFRIVKSWNHEPEEFMDTSVKPDIYPNPTNGIVSIRYQSPESAAMYIYRPDGSLLLSDRIYTDKTIDLSGNGSGVFMVVIENNKEEKRYKVVVQSPEK